MSFEIGLLISNMIELTFETRLRNQILKLFEKVNRVLQRMRRKLIFETLDRMTQFMDNIFVNN